MIPIFFRGGLPWWAIALIALGAAGLLAYQLLAMRQRLSAKKGFLLLSLRAIVYVLLIFFLLSPGAVEKRVTRLRRPLAVLVDTSQSMGLRASGERPQNKSRIDLVKELLLEGKEPWSRRLARDYDVRWYQFSAGLEPIAPSSLGGLAAQGRGTRLVEALREAGREAPAGIVVFSDGIANGETHSLDGSASLPIPVFAVGVGETKGYTDLRISDLKFPDFAFRGREMKVDVAVQAHGLSGKTVPLYFNRGGNLVATRTLTIDRDPFEQRLTLGYIPREIGLHNFTVSLPLQPGEEIARNNQREFKVEIQRDKIRVLTLSGSPSWNYRFLRMALKQDPFIDLVSFVFLRSPTDSVDVPDNQLSLIPFPIDEIFLEEIKNFDVVVFDDFCHRSYFNTVYL